MINAQLAATTTSSSSSILQNTYVTRGRGWRNPWGFTDLSRGSFRLVRDFPETSRWSFGKSRTSRGSRGRLGVVADVSGKSRTSLRQVRDFPETSPTCLGEVSEKSWTSRGSLGEVRVMEFGLNQAAADRVRRLATRAVRRWTTSCSVGRTSQNAPINSRHFASNWPSQLKCLEQRRSQPIVSPVSRAVPSTRVARACTSSK